MTDAQRNAAMDEWEAARRDVELAGEVVADLRGQLAQAERDEDEYRITLRRIEVRFPECRR